MKDAGLKCAASSVIIAQTCPVLISSWHILARIIGGRLGLLLLIDTKQSRVLLQPSGVVRFVVVARLIRAH